jgi:perosamine synthetase
VIEDAAEAHGARYQGKRVGSLGEINAFSFYGNKIITTGEGGLLTTDDDALDEKVRFLRDHAMSPEKRYWHTEIGYNYRMTNLQAALGVAQMERIEEFIAKKRAHCPDL